MQFTEVEKAKFIALLQTKGWQVRGERIWSPSGGLSFSDSDFVDCGPTQMLDLFNQNAARIAKSQIEVWLKLAQEKQEASWAAEEVMKHDSAV